jgi:hypothetical protein
MGLVGHQGLAEGQEGLGMTAAEGLGVLEMTRQPRAGLMTEAGRRHLVAGLKVGLVGSGFTATVGAAGIGAGAQVGPTLLLLQLLLVGLAGQ